MLYSKLAPNGAVTVMLPVAVTHEGCVVLMSGVVGNDGNVTATVVAFEQPETGSKAVKVNVPFWVAVAGLAELTAMPGPFQLSCTPMVVEFPMSFTPQLGATPVVAETLGTAGTDEIVKLTGKEGQVVPTTRTVIE